MTEGKIKILAIIPARGGSKGVPGKNIIKFDGKPLIQYAVDCALNSNLLDKIIINSDDQSILDTVDDKNSERIIKELRPKELGSDNSSIVDVVLHTLSQIKDKYDLVILLQVTSPLRTSQDIKEIVELFTKDEKLEGVVSVVPMDDMNPARMYELGSDSDLKPLMKEAEATRRQDLKPVYYRNGCFYAVKTEVLVQQKTFMPTYKRAYVMNPDHLLNIDSFRDVKLAEVLIKAWKNKEL
jgi:CMP-N-acetylneuraminic acid synthetase